MKHLILIISIAAGISIFVSCNGNNQIDTGTVSPFSAKDSAFLASWKSFKEKASKRGPGVFDMPVDTGIARRCIDTLKEYMSIDPDLTKLVNGYTESVWFGSSSLLAWFEDNEIFKNSDSIAIRLGMYTNEAYEYYKTEGLKEENIGRVTVFIWPYNTQGLVPVTVTAPFNIGSLHP